MLLRIEGGISTRPCCNSGTERGKAKACPAARAETGKSARDQAGVTDEMPDVQPVDWCEGGRPAKKSCQPKELGAIKLLF